MNEFFIQSIVDECLDIRERYGTKVQVLKSRPFAERIVRECIRVCGPEDSYTDEWFKAKADSVSKIKKHFGVE